MNTTLYKYKSLDGNYFILDPIKNTFPITKSFVNKACNESFSIGADGIIRGPFFINKGIKMELFNEYVIEINPNPNSIRVFVQYLLDCGYVTDDTFKIETKQGGVMVNMINKEDSELIKISMKDLIFPEDELQLKPSYSNPVVQSMVYQDKVFHAACLEKSTASSILMLEEMGKSQVQSYRITGQEELEEQFTTISEDKDFSHTQKHIIAAVAAHRLGLLGNQITITSSYGDIYIEIDDEKNIYIAAEAMRNGLLMMDVQHEELSMMSM